MKKLVILASVFLLIFVGFGSANAQLFYDFAWGLGSGASEAPAGFGNNLDINALGNDTQWAQIVTADGTGIAGDGTVQVTITGGSWNGSEQANDGTVGAGFNGIGVYVPPETSTRIDEDQAVTVNFGSLVYVDLLTVFFDGVDFNDTYSLFVDGVQVVNSASIPTVWASPTEIALGVLGQEFSFVGEYPTNVGTDYNRNGFRLLGMTAEAAPVPEPATMLLLGSGLVGLAGFGRKKFFKK